MYDFPNSPTTGQIATGPGGIQWQWDGVKWVVVGSSSTGFAPIGAIYNVGRNLFHNGLFNVQQRGTGPFTTTGTVYTADRWQLYNSVATGSVSIIALSDAQRSTIGDESAVSGLQNTFTGTSGSTDYVALVHKIEKLRRLSGKTVTISFWAVATAALSLGISLDQNFGSGGSPSATVFGNGQAVPITTTFARYQVTLTIPSTAGKTFGSNGDDFQQIFWWCSASSGLAARSAIGVQSGTVTLWGMQLEIGSQATPLEKLDPRYDLANCQRFFTQSYWALNTYSTGANMLYQYPISFRTTMRATPSMSGATTTAAANVIGGAGTAVAAYNSDLFYAYLTAAAAGQASYSGYAYFSADL